MATALDHTPQPGVLFSRVEMTSKDLSVDEWNQYVRDPPE